MQKLGRQRNVRSRSISPENFDGAEAGGGRATDGTGAAAARDLGRGWKVSPSVHIAAGETFTLGEIGGPGEITHIWATTHPNHWRQLLLRVYFDGSAEPAVEVPFGDFFAQSWGTFAQVSSEPIATNPHGGCNSYWPMPFDESARLTLTNLHDDVRTVYYQIDYELFDEPDPDRLYFHAQWRRSNPLVARTNHQLLDSITGRGQYVGTFIAWGSNSTG